MAFLVCPYPFMPEDVKSDRNVLTRPLCSVFSCRKPGVQLIISDPDRKPLIYDIPFIRLLSITIRFPSQKASEATLHFPENPTTWRPQQGLVGPKSLRSAKDPCPNACHNYGTITSKVLVPFCIKENIFYRYLRREDNDEVLLRLCGYLRVHEFNGQQLCIDQRFLLKPFEGTRAAERPVSTKICMGKGLYRLISS